MQSPIYHLLSLGLYWLSKIFCSNKIHLLLTEEFPFKLRIVCCCFWVDCLQSIHSIQTPNFLEESSALHYKKRIKFHSVILSLDLKEVTSPVNQQNYHVCYFYSTD